MRIVVQEWERVLRYRDGRFAELLEPGAHRRPARRTTLTRVDLRPWLITVPGQEVLTADGLAVRVSVQLRARVTDPRRWHEATASPSTFLYAAAQTGLRVAVAARTLDELLAARAGQEAGAEVSAAVAPAAAEVGAEADRATVKDIMVPAELRRAATQLATARAEGQAALERARAEVAAVRALANAARQVADNPALLQLRTLQAVEKGGATVVLGTSGPPTVAV